MLYDLDSACEERYVKLASDTGGVKRVRESFFETKNTSLQLRIPTRGEVF